ncbi:MAG: sodium/solute symporter [Oscillospiraceae bacterium]|nr:sodium/solute symporter [Oscillospiraceae bacterium]
MFWKIFMLAVFFLITVIVGFMFRKKANDVGSFVLGGRNVGPWLTAFAYGTSYFSAVVFVGYAGQFGWNYGISATWIGIGNAVFGSLLAWVVLARRTRIMTKHLDAATMPDFFEKRYDSRAIKLISSLIVFIFLIPYSASVYKGLSGLFSMAFGIDVVYCIIIMAVFTAIYVIIGGYFATAVNDLIQGFIMIVGIILVIVAVLNGKGGFTNAINSLSQIEIEAAPNMKGALVSFFGPDPIGLISVVIMTSFGAWGLPQMVHKFYTIKDERSIKSGTIISTVFALIIAGGSYFMGGFGRLYYSPENGKVLYDNIVPTMLSNQLSDILIGVVLMLVLCASMSTLSSLVITSSSTFVLDFIKDSLKINIDKKKQLYFIRLLCAVFILISVVLALNPNSLITALMSLSWGALAGAFVGPFMYGLFWKRVTKAAVWVSFICGVGFMTANLFISFMPMTMAATIAIIISLIIVPVASLLTRKPDSGKVESIFSCYNEKVIAPTVEVLPDEE